MISNYIPKKSHIEIAAALVGIIGGLFGGYKLLYDDDRLRIGLLSKYDYEVRISDYDIRQSLPVDSYPGGANDYDICFGNKKSLSVLFKNISKSDLSVVLTKWGSEIFEQPHFLKSREGFSIETIEKIYVSDEQEKWVLLDLDSKRTLSAFTVMKICD